MRKKSRLSNNPETHKHWEDQQRKERIFGEVQAASALTDAALHLKREQLSAEGEEVVQALLDDNQRGELTRTGAKLLAQALEQREEDLIAPYTDGTATSHSYHAVGNRVQTLKVKGIRRKEIDAEQLAQVYWLQAKRMVRERREREEARLEKEQVRIDFAAEPSTPAPEPPAEPKPSSKAVAKLRRQLEETRAQLRQLGINPDDGSPLSPEPELGAP